jgi:hypothetical protein
MNTLAEIEAANGHDKQDVILEYNCICCGEPFQFYNRTMAAHELICVGCDMDASLSRELKEKFYRARLTVIDKHPEWYKEGAGERVRKFLAGEILECEINNHGERG